MRDDVEIVARNDTQLQAEMQVIIEKTIRGLYTMRQADRDMLAMHSARRLMAIIARERAAALSAATPAIEARVREACAAKLPQLMQDKWGEICGDTDCHPLDIHRDPRSRKTWFNPGHWVEAIAAAIRKG